MIEVFIMSLEYDMGIVNVISFEEYSSILSVTLLSNMTYSCAWFDVLAVFAEFLVLSFLVGANERVIFTCSETKGTELPLEIMKLDMSPACAVVGGLKVTST